MNERPGNGVSDTSRVCVSHILQTYSVFICFSPFQVIFRHDSFMIHSFMYTCSIHCTRSVCFPVFIICSALFYVLRADFWTLFIVVYVFRRRILFSVFKVGDSTRTFSTSIFQSIFHYYDQDIFLHHACTLFIYLLTDLLACFYA